MSALRTLDVQALHHVTAFVCLVLGAVLLQLAFTASYLKGIVHWALGASGLGLGLVVLGLRPDIPVVVSVLLGNGLMLGAMVLLIEGVRRFRRVPVSAGIDYAMVLMAMAGLYLLLEVWPSFNGRVAVFSLAFGALSARAAYLLWRDRGETRTARCVCAVFALLATVMLYRCVAVLAAAEDGSLTDSPGVTPALTLAWIAVLPAAAFGLMLLVTQRLKFDLEQQALVDVLTDAFNRRAFDTFVAKATARARRSGLPLCVAVMGIDGFKRFNDRHGHLAGDRMLEEFAAVCQAASRTADFFARIGGEEFAIGFPDTGQDEAAAICERLRERVAASSILWNGEALSVTVSVGVAEWAGPLESVSDWLERCDRLLYAAKRNGRDRVERADREG